MIFEALSTLNDLKGSDSSTIASFIEVSTFWFHKYNCNLVSYEILEGLHLPVRL